MGILVLQHKRFSSETCTVTPGPSIGVLSNCLPTLTACDFTFISYSWIHCTANTDTTLANRTKLVASLSSLSIASTALSTIIPPDIIAYVEQGRNPDIYTREFVELVQKRNSMLKGKIEAFQSFAGILEEDMIAAGIDTSVNAGARAGEKVESNEVAIKREEGNHNAG